MYHYASLRLAKTFTLLLYTIYVFVLNTGHHNQKKLE